MLNKKLKLIIIDDEPNAVGLLENYVHKYFNSEIEIVGTFTDSLIAYEQLKSRADLDLVFIDINMPQMDGLEFLEAMPSRTFEVVFITAHSSHALKAYKNKALDYILKPIDKTEFVNSISLVLDRVRKINRKEYNHSNVPKHEKLAILKNGTTIFVNVEDISYFRAQGSYTQVLTNNGNYIISKSLKNVLEEISSQKILRINRSFAVNKDFIKGYNLSNDGTIVLKDDYEIGISRIHKKSIIAEISKKMD